MGTTTQNKICRNQNRQTDANLWIQSEYSTIGKAMTDMCEKDLISCYILGLRVSIQVTLFTIVEMLVGAIKKCRVFLLNPQIAIPLLVLVYVSSVKVFILPDSAALVKTSEPKIDLWGLLPLVRVVNIYWINKI